MTILVYICIQFSFNLKGYDTLKQNDDLTINVSFSSSSSSESDSDDSWDVKAKSIFIKIVLNKV